MLPILASALVTLVAAWAAGAGVARLSGLDAASPYAPAIGLATLIVVAAVAIKLPGEAVAALLAIAAVALAGGWFGRAGLRAVATRADVWAVAAGALLVSCIPFAVNERFGLLGVSFNNDLAVHLPWMEALRSDGAEAAQGLPAGYPLGPHSVVDAVAELLAVRLDEAVTGLLVAAAVMTALAALAALRRLPAPARVVAAILSAFAYLLASYYGQGSFKETIFALCVLTLALILQDVIDEGSARGRLLVVLGALLACALYTFSYFGVLWLAAVIGLWGAAEAGARGMLREPRRLVGALRPFFKPAAAAAALVLVALAPELSRLIDLFREAGLSPAGQGAIEKDNLGNLAHALSPYEALGVWRQDDFRFGPTSFSKYAGALVAIAAVGYGLLWSLRRRAFAVPAAAAVCGVVYLYTDRTESPYVSAKALVIAAPLLMLVALRALFDPQDGRPLRAPPRLAAVVLGLVFVLAAGGSTYLTLRGAQVGADEEASELRSFRSAVDGKAVLFLGMDDYYRYALAGAHLGHGHLVAEIPTPPRAEKRWEYGKPFDFDTPEPELLDRFDYVLAPRTSYASETPANFELVRSTRSFALWRRDGPTVPRELLDEGEAPGAILNCRTRRGRRLSRTRGFARVRSAPVVVGPIRSLEEGDSTVAVITLARGSWDLDLQYTSARKLIVEWPGSRIELIPRQSRPGPFWHVGTVTLERRTPLQVKITHEEPSVWSRTQVGYPTLLAATRSTDTPRTIPLRAACGRYVDWYKLAPAGS
jgi:hypothetical protein